MYRNNSIRILQAMKKLRHVVTDIDRKPLLQMLTEFVISSLKTKTIAKHYFTSYLYRKNITNYMDYLCEKEWKYLQRVICDSETAIIQFNKLFFQYYFQNANIPMPKLLAYSIREKMIIRNNDIWLSREILSHEDLNNIINDLLAMSANNSVFIKPMTGSEGKGILRISNRPNETPNLVIPDFYKHFISGSYIFQDEVKQHKDLAKINPNTLNTMRIDTFKKPGCTPEILSGLLRIGRSYGYVDNTGSGGMFIGIDMSKGTLKEFALTYLGHGGMIYNAHPDTGYVFYGFQIPMFEEAKQLVLEAASFLPTSLMGWDIAVSEEGPVMIEGNSVYYSVTGLDITYGGYRKNPVYCKVVDYVKNDLKK